MKPLGVLSVHPRCAFGLIIIQAAAVLTLSCGGDSGTAPSPSSLAGTWGANYALFTSVSNPSQSVELISQGGTVTLSLNAGGTFTLITTRPGLPDDGILGTWTASSDTLTLRPTGTSFDIQFDMTLSGGMLTLNGGHVEFDINGDGVDEETILDMRMIRQ